MLLSRRVQTFTVNEFFNLDKKEELLSLDRAIGHIKRNKKLYMKLVISIAFYIFIFKLKVIYAGSEVIEVIAANDTLTFAELMSRAELFGKTLIKGAVKVGRTIIILLMIYAIVKDAFEGANHRVGNKFLFFIFLLILVSIAPYLEPMLDGFINSIFQK